jgi:hypothetical protein
MLLEFLTSMAFDVHIAELTELILSHEKENIARAVEAI